MRIHLLYLIAIVSTLEVAVTILYKHRACRQGSAHVYKTTLLLVEEGLI